MKNTHTSTLARIAIIGMIAAAASAAQARGITIRTADESLVSAGMTQADVQHVLGQPAAKERFMNEPGATWTYEVPDQIAQRTVFDVDFAADGTVLSASERVVDIN